MQWESLGCIRIGDMVEASPGLQKLGVPIGTKGIVFEIDDPDTCEYTDHYIHVRWFNEFKIRAKVTELVLLESNPFAGHAVVA
ncbi:MAG: hypothetical protein Q7R88_01975 [bacterium]|nr:hypothetical protein [bacterium]